MTTLAKAVFALTAFLALPALADTYIEGIGIAISRDEARFTVLEVFQNGPAEAGGLQKSDVIIAVDGKPVLGKSLKQIVKTIRGPAGTPIPLTLSDEVGHIREAH